MESIMGDLKSEKNSDVMKSKPSHRWADRIRLDKFIQAGLLIKRAKLKIQIWAHEHNKNVLWL